MWNKLIQIINGKDCELRERMLRAIILVGGLVTIAGIFEILIIMEMNKYLLPLLFLLLIAMGISVFITLKYRKYNIGAVLIGIVIVVMVFPLMFFLSGGIEGGATVWLSLGIVYVFLMFEGKKQVLFFILCMAVYGITYWCGYNYPGLITPMGSRFAVYADSYFAVCVVGICIGAVVKSQMRVYEEEHQLNISQKEELERSSAAKNIFFANMSHEIRTPINAIIGLNEMILRTSEDESIREYAKDIQLASKMLLNQVNDILDLSQMEMEKMKIIPVEYSLEQLFSDLAELVRVQMERKGLEFFVNIDSNLPAVVMGDEKRLKQVLLNILDNAVKYTKEGSVVLTAQGEEDGLGNIVLKVKVADTGIGIKKEDIEYLYDSFNRVDEKKNSRIVGSGLGLAITKQLVDLMGGEITVDSIYTKGTVFSVILKQKIVSDKKIGVVNFRQHNTDEGEFYKQSFEAPEARILIVDDNDLNARVAYNLLAATKVQIDIAKSGDECLEFTKKKFYHVILMDYMMPGMDGTETLKALRTQANGLCRETSVVIMTANAVSEARQMYLEQGFDGYVEKPISGKLLEKEIMALLPPDIIEYVEGESIVAEKISQIQKTTIKKRKRVYVTADCTCDLPAELLEKYDIQVMYLYIKTPNGRFADTREIDSDSLGQYLSAVSSTAVADSVTVEEYEEFFAEMLTQADRVVHITLGSNSGRSNEIALTAAKGFDHVRVIDSDQLSCGQGLIVLYAAKLAQEGKLASEICEAVEAMKAHICSKFIMPGADIFYKNGRTSAMVAGICRGLGLHPIVEMKQKKAIITGVVGGELESVWKKVIRKSLNKPKKISSEVVFITHVGCSVRQQEMIVAEIMKYVKFEKVIINKASFTTACNSGMESVGIAYYSL